VRNLGGPQCQRQEYTNARLIDRRCLIIRDSVTLMWPKSVSAAAVSEPLRLLTAMRSPHTRHPFLRLDDVAVGLFEMASFHF
jgi:hypothetical protein